jgi:hypothetical protein
MNAMMRPAAAIAAVVLAILVAARHAPASHRAGIVSVFADSQAELDRHINEDLKYGAIPRYLVVRTRGRAHRFSVYAGVAGDRGMLVVLGYGAVFVFDGSDRLAYTGRRSAYSLSELPAIAVPLPTVKNARLCAECAAASDDPRVVVPFARALEQVADPWQVDPGYTPWRPIPPEVLRRKITAPQS